MAKTKQKLAQGQNETTCLPSSNVVLGVHRESLGGGERGDDTDDTTQPPSVVILEGAEVKELDGLEGQG